MIRNALIILWMCCSSLVWSQDIDLSKLEKSEGSDFQNELDRMVVDLPLITVLRGTLYAGNSRHELLKCLVLARVDYPEVFRDFQAILDLAQPGSPLWTTQWSSDVARARGVLIGRFMREWARAAPAPQSFVDWYTSTIDINEPQGRDGVVFAQRMWPAFAFGIAAAEKNLRGLTRPVFRSWCEESKYSELSLEARLWLCERSDYDPDEIWYYNIQVGEAMQSALPGQDKARLVTRHLLGFEDGERFVQVTNNPGIAFRLDSAEKYGTAAHSPALRRLADKPIWLAYRDRMLQVADELEKPRDKPKEK